jgi:hypothetical protein
MVKTNSGLYTFFHAQNTLAACRSFLQRYSFIHFYSRLRGNAILTTYQILCVTNALADSHKAT